MNQKLDQNLLLQPIKIEVAKIQDENKKQETKPIKNGQDKVIKPRKNQAYTEALQTYKSRNKNNLLFWKDYNIEDDNLSEDSVIVNEEELQQLHNSSKTFEIFQHKFIQDQYISKHLPIITEIKQNTYELQYNNNQKYQNKLYERNLQEFNNFKGISKQCYVKWLLNPIQLIQQKEQEIKKYQELQEKQQNLQLSSVKNKNLKKKQKIDEKIIKKQQELKILIQQTELYGNKDKSTYLDILQNDINENKNKNKIEQNVDIKIEQNETEIQQQDIKIEQNDINQKQIEEKNQDQQQNGESIDKNQQQQFNDNLQIDQSQNDNINNNSNQFECNEILNDDIEINMNEFNMDSDDNNQENITYQQNGDNNIQIENQDIEMNLELENGLNFNQKDEINQDFQNQDSNNIQIQKDQLFQQITNEQNIINDNNNINLQQQSQLQQQKQKNSQENMSQQQQQEKQQEEQQPQKKKRGRQPNPDKQLKKSKKKQQKENNQNLKQEETGEIQICKKLKMEDIQQENNENQQNLVNKNAPKTIEDQQNQEQQLSKQEKQKLEQEEHEKRLKLLNQEQLYKYKLFSIMTNYKSLKNKLNQKQNDKYFNFQKVEKNDNLLQRNFYLRQRNDPLALELEQDEQESMKKKEGILPLLDNDEKDTIFQLKFELEQKQRKQRRHQDFMKNILNHTYEFFEFHKKVQRRAKKRCTTAKQLAEYRMKRRGRLEDRKKQGILDYIRENNMDEYIKIIKEKKSERIDKLLQETDNFLRSLGGKIMIQKGKKIEDTADEELLFGQKSEDKVQNYIQSNKVYYQLTHSIKEEVKQQPKLIQNGQLKNYQLVGLSWLVSLYNNKLNGILADEMGLGKTIQTISLFAHLIETKKVFGPFLVVVPLSTLPNWAMEFDKWAPSIKYVQYKDAPAVRKEISKWMKIGTWHVCLTTYDYILKDKNTLSKWNWKYIVIDEGHRMKNSRSKFAQMLGQQYHSDYRVLLTGTPLQNNLAELWALLNFLLPKVFENCDDFEKWFSLPLGKNTEALKNVQEGEETKNMELTEEEQLLIINRLHQVLRPFLLRRVKKEVEAELPSKTETIIKVDMSPWQKLYYDQLEQKQQICQDPVTGKIQFSMLNNLVMQLRKICNHPYLFLNDFGIDEGLWRSSGKMELLDRILPKLLQTKHRILIFTQMTQVIDIMQYYFEIKGIKFLRLDGSTKADDRGKAQKEFNKEGTEYDVFILSTRAGGLGLNLQSADTVIIFDSDWNPQQDLQAQDRAHRIGSKREVKVFRLITANSVEEAILQKARYKMGLDEMIIQAGMYNQKSSEDERTKKIENLLVRKKTGNDSENNIPTDEQINEMISRSEQEFQYFQQLDKDRYQQEKKIYPYFEYPPQNLDDDEDEDEDQNQKEWYNYRYLPEQDIPEWIRNPPKPKEEENTDGGRGSRQKKQVNYNESMNHNDFMKYIGAYVSKEERLEKQKGNKNKSLKDYQEEEELYLQEQQQHQNELRKKSDALKIEDIIDFDEDDNQEEEEENKDFDELFNDKQNKNKKAKNNKLNKTSKKKRKDSVEDDLFGENQNNEEIFQSDGDFDIDVDYDDNQQKSKKQTDDDIFIED